MQDGDDRVRVHDQPEWVREVIGNLRAEIHDLRGDYKHLVEIEVHSAKRDQMMAQCAETMARYGSSLDAINIKMHTLEKALLSNRIKLLWTTSGALGGALLAIGIWLVTHAGMVWKS